jgi:hypothetical protein
MSLHHLAPSQLVTKEEGKDRTGEATNCRVDEVRAKRRKYDSVSCLELWGEIDLLWAQIDLESTRGC